MADPEAKQPDPPPHPARFVSGAIAAVGGMYAAIGALRGEPFGATFGLALLGFGVVSMRLGSAAQLANSIAAAINGGDEPRARALLEKARSRHRVAYVVRMLDSHESELAWRAGDLDAVLQWTGRALSHRDVLPIGRWGEVHRAHVNGLRAVALATRGDPSAKACITAVRDAHGAWPGALARVELAEAILRVHDGDLEGAQKHLAEQRALLSENLDPRGQTLSRAVRGFALRRATEIYRLPLRTALRDHDARAEWLSRVFPRVIEIDDAPLAPAREADLAALEVVAAPAFAGLAPVPKHEVKVVSRLRSRVLLLWIALVIAFVVIWSAFDAPGRKPGLPIDWVLAAAPLFLIVMLAIRIQGARRKHQALSLASRALAIGDFAEAEVIAGRFLNDVDVTVAASAAYTFACAAERRGDFAEALRRCDAGLSRVRANRLTKAATVDIIGPQLVSLRAFVLAALGRVEASEAELACLDREFPTFAYAPSARARTRLVLAARRGDLDEALAIAAQREDLVLGASADGIADLVVAARAPDRAERLEVAREELAADPRQDAWIRAAVPNLIESLRQKG